MVAEALKTISGLRCWRCNKQLAEEITPPYTVTCPRCHATNKATVEKHMQVR